jgi:hyperosmotically inducible periplasmic protein
MINKLIMAVALSAAVAFAVAGPAYSTEKSDKDAKSDANMKSDNSKMNKAMHANKEQTADQQGESKADRKMTQDIRRAVVKDKELSQYAHNVKIITKDGMVTLKGPVRSAQEKSRVEAIATKIAGGKVTNEMEIAPPKDKDKKEMKEHDKKEMKEKY